MLTVLTVLEGFRIAQPRTGVLDRLDDLIVLRRHVMGDKSRLLAKSGRNLTPASVSASPLKRGIRTCKDLA